MIKLRPTDVANDQKESHGNADGNVDDGLVTRGSYMEICRLGRDRRSLQTSLQLSPTSVPQTICSMNVAFDDLACTAVHTRRRMLYLLSSFILSLPTDPDRFVFRFVVLGFSLLYLSTVHLPVEGETRLRTATLIPHHTSMAGAVLRPWVCRRRREFGKS